MRPIHTLPIPSSILTKLLDEGYLFCEDIFDIKGVKSEVKEILSFVSSAYDSITWDDIEHLIVVPTYQTAIEILQDEQNVTKILTFSQAFDKILGGGISLGEVVEFCGASGSGKTQMCLQLCVAVQLPTCLGGVQGEAIYVDTDNSFTPTRLKDIAESCSKLYSDASGYQGLKLEPLLKNLDGSKLLKGVHYIKIQDNIQFLAVVTIIEEFIKKNDKVKLVVIDSLTFPFLDPFITNNLVRTQQICRIIRQLQSIAANFKIAVVVTNQLTTKIVQQEAKLAPAMGENYAHIISKRIIFGDLQNSKFSAAVYKSSYLPELYSEFEISSDGIRDVT